jgi:site-specific DNA-methyltransferase (adenine-specific)
MIFNCIDWPRDNESEKIHPTQKPVKLLEQIIEIFTDPGDVVIDPVAGSGSTIVASDNLGRKAHGFEIKKNFHADATNWIERNRIILKEIKELGFAKTEISKQYPTLF